MVAQAVAQAVAPADPCHQQSSDTSPPTSSSSSRSQTEYAHAASVTASIANDVSSTQFFPCFPQNQPRFVNFQATTFGYVQKIPNNQLQ